MPDNNLQNNNIQCDRPLIGFIAYSGTGKTTLLKQVLPILKTKGLHIGMIKHAHHNFDIDIPGKDSYELRKAGADQMLVASRYRWALITEQNNPEQDPSLQAMIDQLDTGKLDLILVEGFKHSSFAKIELHRPSMAKPLLYPKDKNIIAVASDEKLQPEPTIPFLDLNDPQEIADFVIQYCQAS